MNQAEPNVQILKKGEIIMGQMMNVTHVKKIFASYFGTSSMQ